MIEHAMNSVPFYHKVYGDTGVRPDLIRSVADIVDLPFLTHRHLQKHLPYLISRRRWLLFCEMWHSSGTTGVPVYIVHSLFWQLRYFVHLEARLPQLGLRPSDFRPLAANFMYLTDTEYRPYYRGYRRRIPIFRLSKSEIIDFRPEFGGDERQTLEKVSTLDPVIIHGKPSSLTNFLEMRDRCDPSGTVPIRPKVVVTGAEQLLPEVRERLGQGFACPVFDAYGLAEVGPIACECTAHKGLHVDDDEIVVEIVGKDGPVAPGESGEIVITNLCDWTMPILRYRTGDVGRMTYEPCECGLTSPRILELEGRVIDFFVTPDGETVNPFVLLGGLPKLGLEQFQIVQRSPRQVVVRYVGDVPRERVCDAIRELVRARMGPEVRVSAEQLRSFAGGGLKHRLYVNEMSNG